MRLFHSWADNLSTTEGKWHLDDQTTHEALPWLAEGMRRRRSMPDVGRRQKPADGLRRRSLVGFPPGDDVEPWRVAGVPLSDSRRATTWSPATRQSRRQFNILPLLRWERRQLAPSPGPSRLCTQNSRREHIFSVLNTQKHLENIPIGNKKHRMSIHNI